MGARVKMRAILDALEFQPGEASSYLNRQTGEVVTISDEELHAAEDEESALEAYPEWQRTMIGLARDIIADENQEIYLALPTTYDIHEYGIMERFCLSLKDEEISNSLYQAIKGKGAFRRFREAIQRYGIAEDWYTYRDDAIRTIAIDWCEANGIEYSED